MDAGAAAFDPQTVPGFLTDEEGRALEALAAACASIGPIVEIGSYCGRSTVYLARGARRAGGAVLAIDHHRGSEEHQPGWDWHDPALWDEAAGRVDTLPHFRQTLREAGIEDVVIPIVTDAGRALIAAPVAPGLVFIDGGHTMTAALRDWRVWGARVAAGGVLAIHDVFPDPADGGRPPYEVFRRAAASGLFDVEAQTGSLMTLRRVA